MSEQESAWFYTQHGERKGPVTLDVLRGAIEHLKVDREKDLVWGPGLSDWVTVDKVPELQGLSDGPPPVSAPREDASPSPVASKTSPDVAPASGANLAAKPAPAASSASNPYTAPTSQEDDNALADAMAARRDGQGYPGMGRLMFWFAPTLVGLVVILGAVFLAGAVGGEQGESMLIIMTSGYLIATLICLFMTFSRLRNLAMSRWNVLWSIVPIMSIWLCYRLYICPAGYHEHRKLDSAGKVLVGVYILLFVGYLGAILTVGSGYYKEAADEARQQIEQQQRSSEADTNG